MSGAARRIIGAMLCAMAMAGTAPVAAGSVTVFAAASLATAMDGIAAAWRRDTGIEVRISYAASSALARQIEQGAPSDIYISADRAWMDELEDKGLIETGTRIDLLGNELVLVAPQESVARNVEIGSALDLAGLLGDGRLAVAETSAVPAGRYARSALETLGLWDGVKDRLAQGENVRATLLLVARAEAPYGIVYRTDAAAEPDVRIVGTFPPDSHPPIVYPAALVAGAGASGARAFLDFLASPEAMRLFEAQGFNVLD